MVKVYIFKTNREITAETVKPDFNPLFINSIRLTDILLNYTNPDYCHCIFVLLLPSLLRKVNFFLKLDISRHDFHKVKFNIFRCTKLNWIQFYYEMWTNCERWVKLNNHNHNQHIDYFHHFKTLFVHVCRVPSSITSP